MTPDLNILDQYIQMREGNSSRELADMALIKELRAQLLATQKENEQLIAENKALKQTIADMKDAQPVNNTYHVERDLVQNQTITQLPV